MTVGKSHTTRVLPDNRAAEPWPRFERTNSPLMTDQLSMRHLIRALIKYSLLLFALAPATSTLLSQTIDVPLVELPYNFANGARAPGMQQSLRITTSVYEA